MKAFLRFSLELQLTLLFGVVRLREWLVLQFMRKERLGSVEKRGQKKTRADVLVHGKEISPERNDPWEVVNEMGWGLLRLQDPRRGTENGQTAPVPAAFVGAGQPEASRVGT